ncbi:MAG: DUF4340 domain-containing protein [Eubacteriales bacterium]|nr:DUF4340 domain-containing protein [Eubacteriales bacterium]
MRKFKGAIISILLLALLVGGYFIVNNIDAPVTQEPAEEGDTLPFGDVLTVQAEDIVYFEVTNSYGNYSFSKVNNSWICNNDKNIVLVQETVNSQLFSASYYDGYTIHEGEYDPSDYGLDKPTMTIKLRLSDNTQHICTYGSAAPVDDHLYYLSIDDKKAVYAGLGAKYDMLNVPLGAYRDPNFFTFDYTGIKKITIANRGETPIVIEEDTSENGSYISSWNMTSPYKHTVNEFTLANLIIEPLAEAPVNVIAYVEDSPSNLDVYGLANPKHIITFNYSDRTETIKIGDEAENSTVYAMKNNDRTVYTIKSGHFSFAKYSAFELVDKSVYFALITELSSLEIKGPKGTYNITIPKDGGTYEVNGKKVSEKKVKAFYEELALLSIGGVVKENVSTSPETVLTYNYLDGSKGVAEFIPYKNRYYAIRIDGGKADFYVKKADVSDLLSIIAEL